jgi:hypothetical protein
MARVHVATGVTFVLIACAACGPPLPPSSSAVGDWEGRDVTHFEYLHIRFTQQGSNLQGTACYTSDVHLVFSGVPAQVNYPHVSVSAPNRFTFVGEFQANGTITGNRGTGASSYPMTLTRDTLGGYAVLCTTP